MLPWSPLSQDRSSGARKREVVTRLSTDIMRFPSTVWRAIQAAGIEPAAVLRKAGLPASLYLDPRTPLSVAQYFSIWKAIEALVDDSGFALRIVEKGNRTGHQPGFIAGLYAASFRDALNRLLRYRLISSEKLWTCEDHGLWTLGREWLFTAEAEPALSIDLTFTLIVELGRRGSGRPIKPVKVQYMRDFTRCEELERFYGCPIRFGAPHNAITFESADLDIPFPGHSPEFLELITHSLAASVEEQKAHGSFSDHVKSVMKHEMMSGRPEIGHVASELGMGVRTLQRRITDAGTNYRALLIEARRELGLQLVANPDLDTQKITSMLGYQDAASFYRAFKDWEGMSPGEWRAQHLMAERR